MTEEDLVKDSPDFPALHGRGRSLSCPVRKKVRKDAKIRKRIRTHRKDRRFQAAQVRLKKIPEELEEFPGTSYIALWMRQDWISKRERVYYMPAELPDLKGIRFLRTGLLARRTEEESV